jgi:hypothetical protein
VSTNVTTACTLAAGQSEAAENVFDLADERQYYPLDYFPASPWRRTRFSSLPQIAHVVRGRLMLGTLLRGPLVCVVAGGLMTDARLAAEQVGIRPDASDGART